MALSLSAPSVLFGEEEQYSAKDVDRLLTERRYRDLQPVLQRIEQQWAAEVRREDSPLNRYDWARTLHSLGGVEKKIGLTDEAVKHLRLARDATSAFSASAIATLHLDIGSRTTSSIRSRSSVAVNLLAGSY